MYVYDTISITMKTKTKCSILFRSITISLVCLFIASDITWAQACPSSSYGPSSNATTLAVQSRLKPFFEKYGIDFQSIALVAMAANKLKNSIIVEKKREGSLYTDIRSLNNLFPNGGIEIEKQIKTDNFKCSGKEYKYAVFHFREAQKTINVLFLEDHTALTAEELRELRINDTEMYNLDCPGLEGVWLINPATAPIHATQQPLLSTRKKAGKEFPLEPKDVPRVETPYRRIQTKIPVPESLSLLKRLRENEPRSMSGQPPIVWSKDYGVTVEDPYGNKWLDWSSGVLVTNIGHGHPALKNALKAFVENDSPLHTYCFPNKPRADLVERLIKVSPRELNKVFLLSTGSEATEVSMKLARTYGIRKNPNKRVIISFEGDFHGRTYAAQMAGNPMDWVDQNPYFIKVPFPGSVETKDKSFDVFLRTLKDSGVNPEDVAGVISETFQGREVKLMPLEYAKALREWCNAHDVALIFDEVQAGFGRTGKLFAFEHYGIIPDMVCCGKGISSSLPLSAVIGKEKYMDLYGPGEMTSTHSANPLIATLGLASVNALFEEKLIENAEKVGRYLEEQLRIIVQPYQDRIDLGGVGLVYGMLFFNNRNELEPDRETAFKFCQKAFESGNLFFAPVGKGYGAIKFCPPLCITKEAIDDGLYGKRGIKEILDEVMQQKSAEEAQSESIRIHAENLKYTPAIPQNTILCHIITDSILPEGQRNMLKTLEKNMRGECYSEKVVSLSVKDQDKFVEELNALMARQRDLYKDRTVKFDVACPSTELVNAILKSNLGINALAFEPCKEADLVQVEGIILALRALNSGKIESLREAFKILAGKEMPQELSAITDINELIKRITFALPATKVVNYNYIRQLNEIIRKNIEVAA